MVVGIGLILRVVVLVALLLVVHQADSLYDRLARGALASKRGHTPQPRLKIGRVDRTVTGAATCLAPVNRAAACLAPVNRAAPLASAAPRARARARAGVHGPGGLHRWRA